MHALVAQVAAHGLYHVGVKIGQNLRKHLDQMHRNAPLTQGFDHFQADIPGANDHRASRFPFGDELLDRLGIGEPPQGEDAGQVHSGNWGFGGRGACGVNKLRIVLTEVLAGLQIMHLNGVGGGVYGDHLMVQAHVETTFIPSAIERERHQFTFALHDPGNPVGHTAHRIGDVGAALKDDYVGGRALALDLAGGAHAGGVTADDDIGRGGKGRVDVRWKSRSLCCSACVGMPRNFLSGELGRISSNRWRR